MEGCSVCWTDECVEEALSLVVVAPCFYPTVAEAELTSLSALNNHLQFYLYGVGEQFIPHGAHAQVERLYEFMERKLADYILVTDCRDVIFTAGEDEILTKFKACGKDLLMSTEQGCWPSEPELVNHYYGKDRNGYNYINAGQYIGTWEYVRFCLKHLLDNYRFKTEGADNSQGWWMWAQIRGELDFALDSGCEVFQSMSGGASEHLSGDKRPMNIWTGSYPCSIHFNGNPGVKEPHRGMFERIYG